MTVPPPRPHTHRTLALSAEPRSVHAARAWVGEVLGEIGREELVDNAQLAVSELVTNAILHSEPPIVVRLRGTKAHPRIEVRDNSRKPPTPEPVPPGDLLTTTGRGLHLIAVHATTWGSDLDEQGTGKTVWFEPAQEPEEDESLVDLDGQVFDIDDALAKSFSSHADEPVADVVRLLGMPAQLFAGIRAHQHELARELRLLSLTEPDRYPTAAAVSETFVKSEHERRLALGTHRLDEAIASGATLVDLEYTVPVGTDRTMARLREQLDRVYDELGADELLAIRLTPLQRRLQHWYLDEFVRQAAGEQPIPWTGPAVDPDQPGA